MDTIKLLLVEDDPSLRYIVQSGLEDIIEGYEVLAAANGEEGLAMWREHRPRWSCLRWYCAYAKPIQKKWKTARYHQLQLYDFRPLSCL